jgi:hypothetical protein
MRDKNGKTDLETLLPSTFRVIVARSPRAILEQNLVFIE